MVKKKEPELWHVEYVDPDNGEKVSSNMTDWELNIICGLLPKQEITATKKIDANGETLTLTFTRFPPLPPVTEAGASQSGCWSAAGDY
jgi:hypothetical protein